MSIMETIKKLLGLVGVDDTTATAIGGVAQMAAGMKQSSDNADAVDVLLAQQYVFKLADYVRQLNTEDVAESLKNRNFDEAKYRIEGLEEDVKDFVDNMREEEPDDSVRGDMSLVKAAQAHAEAFGKLLPDLKKIVELARNQPAENGNTPELDAAFKDFNDKHLALTHEWNNALNAFLAKHKIPAQMPE